MPIIDLPKVRLHVQELNPDGPETIIMVHGMFSNLAVYYFNIAPMLAKHYRVVLFDMKGHGMSEKVRTGYDLTSMTDDLRDLMDALGIEKAHLAGYSYGGLVALKMAARFPERVGKLAIIEGPERAGSTHDHRHLQQGISDPLHRKLRRYHALACGQAAVGEEPPDVRVFVP